VVERFLDTIHTTLPDGARVIKTLGDEAMIVGPDPAALTVWAVTLREALPEQPRPQAAVHYGRAHYRDGDYYGREVNLAARVAGEARGGQVLVTRAVVEAAGPDLRFEATAEVRLRGFQDPTELFLAFYEQPELQEPESEEPA
jgi:adenylate cyclase